MLQSLHPTVTLLQSQHPRGTHSDTITMSWEHIQPHCHNHSTPVAQSACHNHSTPGAHTVTLQNHCVPGPHKVTVTITVPEACSHIIIVLGAHSQHVTNYPILEAHTVPLPQSQDPRSQAEHAAEAATAVHPQQLEQTQVSERIHSTHPNTNTITWGGRHSLTLCWDCVTPGTVPSLWAATEP